MHQPLIIGHRGCRGYAQENTVGAFREAICRGAGMVEMDVRTSSDAEAILFHDASPKRIVGVKKDISQYLFSTLNSQFSTLSLGEALAALSGKTRVDIEIKTPEAARAAVKIFPKYIGGGKFCAEDILISSDSAECLRIVSSAMPHTRTGLIVRAYPKNVFFAGRSIASAKKMRATTIIFSKWILRKKYIQMAHREGLRVFVFTVNDSFRMRRFSRWGVDGIITDYPERR